MKNANMFSKRSFKSASFNDFCKFKCLYHVTNVFSHILDAMMKNVFQNVTSMQIAQISNISAKMGIALTPAKGRVIAHLRKTIELFAKERNATTSKLDVIQIRIVQKDTTASIENVSKQNALKMSSVGKLGRILHVLKANVSRLELVEVILNVKGNMGQIIGASKESVEG